MVIATFWPSTFRSALSRYLRQSFSSSHSLSIALDTDVDYKAKVRARKYEYLLDSLNREHPNPSRAWDSYLDLLDSLGLEQLPVEIHQRVLRKCAPPISRLRASAARRLQAGNVPKTPHMYEFRFQIIVRNIRAAGLTPSLEDYHFILQQFAAVGHHAGAVQILQEMLYLGVQPLAKTYGLCLQAIAHRLTLPCAERRRENLLAECSRLSTIILDTMSKCSMPYTSVNLDLAIRIWKDTDSPETFERILKAGYGIDLAYPDRYPLDLPGDTKYEIGDAPIHSPPTFQPFSTAALNTAIDFLGRAKRISKMVQAFEVLTVPLPRPCAEPSLAFDDDDDDDGFSISGEAPTHRPYPSAEPNTTTYCMLIKYLARARHTVFARHYVIQAMELDRDLARRLKRDLESKPLTEIFRPRFSVNRGILLPLLGLSSQDRDLSLIRWLLKRTRIVKKYKKEDITFFDAYLARVAPSSSEGSADITLNVENVIASPSTPSPAPSELRLEEQVLHHSPLSPSTPLATSSGAMTINIVSRNLQPKTKKDPLHPLDMDLDAPPIRSPFRPRHFDIGLQLALLQRDVTEIKELESRIKYSLLRLTQRAKEKHGRRVWRGKDVYLSHVGKRVTVSREQWKGIVRFQGSKAERASSRQSTTAELRRQDAPHMQRLNDVDPS